MTNSGGTEALSIVLYIMLGIFVILLLILAFVVINMQLKKRKKDDEKIGKDNEKIAVKSKTKNFTINSIFDFMEFDKIEDNMIVQKNGTRYVMVVECQGINYDLMSQAEKIGVEEGFIQFLNTLSYPIQLYIQTRKINLDSSLNSYKSEVSKIEQEYSRQRVKYQALVANPNSTEEDKKQALYEFTKQRNLNEYGKDIIYNTERMSLNKNILNKKYYVVIPYYPEEASQGNFAKEEVREMAFSELYTRAQSIISTLSVSSVIGRVLTSTELVELLYSAYNRDDSEVYGVDKAIKAGYDELYSTGQDYMEKKMQMLDAQIQDEALHLATSKVNEVRSEKQKEYVRKVETKEDIINNLAQLILSENEAMLGKDVAEKAKEKVRKERKSNVQKETTESNAK